MKIYREINENGGEIIKEMNMGEEKRQSDFKRRKRIIEGIQIGIIVVEEEER